MRGSLREGVETAGATRRRREHAVTVRHREAWLRATMVTALLGLLEGPVRLGAAGGAASSHGEVMRPRRMAAM
eukprot:gene5004-4821_t